MKSFLILCLGVTMALAMSRDDFIADINGKTNLWKAGRVARFEQKAIGEGVKDLCGVKPHSQQLVKSKAKVHRFTTKVELPTNFDSVVAWPHCAGIIGDIRDQSNCGCCWAFGAASAASDRLCIATNGTIAVPLSAQEVCFCASQDGCSGGDLMTPWEFIQQNGLVTGGQYNGTGQPGGGWCSAFSLPHCHHHGPQGNDPYPPEGSAGCPSQSSPQCPSQCDANANAPHNNFGSDGYTFSDDVTNYNTETDIMTAIYNQGPVEAAFDVYADFENYVSGIYHHVSGDMVGGHAIRIVGWGVDKGVKYWKIANSWNPWWGEKGYFRMRRGVNECNIESQVTASSPDAVWGPFSGLKKKAL